MGCVGRSAAVLEVILLWESTSMIHRETGESQLTGIVSSACLESCSLYTRLKEQLTLNLFASNLLRVSKRHRIP